MALQDSASLNMSLKASLDKNFCLCPNNNKNTDHRRLDSRVFTLAMWINVVQRLLDDLSFYEKKLPHRCSKFCWRSQMLAQFLRVQRSNFKLKFQVTQCLKWLELCMSSLISPKTTIIRPWFHFKTFNRVVNNDWSSTVERVKTGPFFRFQLSLLHY